MEAGDRNLHARSHPVGVETPESRASTTAALVGTGAASLPAKDSGILGNAWLGAGPEPSGDSNPAAAKKTEAERYFRPERFLESYTPAPVGRVRKRQRAHLESGCPQLISQSVLKWSPHLFQPTRNPSKLRSSKYLFNCLDPCQVIILLEENGTGRKTCVISDDDFVHTQREGLVATSRLGLCIQRC